MYSLDQRRLRRACDSVAAGYDSADFFCAEVRARLLDCLDFMALEPQSILDLGCGTGAAGAALHDRYPAALIVELDWSEQMLRQAVAKGESAIVCADSHQLPFANDSFDLVVSNLMLPTCAEPRVVYSEVHRVLRAPGLFLFTSLGPDTLLEIRRAWATVEAQPHVHAFADMHNIGDALVHAGFRDPVMDTEILTVNYGELAQLVHDLRAVAATNFTSDRRRGLTAPGLWRRFAAQLDSQRSAAGKLPVSLEIVTGQAWRGSPGIGVPLENGEARFPLSQLRYRKGGD